MGLLDFFSNKKEISLKEIKIQSNHNIPIIDITKDMNVIIEQLAQNYKYYCNYPEIFNIKENERLNILKYVWNNWNRRSDVILQDLENEYTTYNRNDLKIIVFTEYWRLHTFYKANKDVESGFSNKIYHYRDFFTPLEFDTTNGNGAIVKELHCCFAKDMPQIQKVWQLPNGKINHIDFSTSPCWEKYVEKCFFFIDNEEKEMKIEDFKNFCNQYSSKTPEFPLLNVSFHFAKTREEEIKEWLNEQLKGIELLLNRGRITEEKAEEFKKGIYKEYETKLKRLEK